ncbi:MAG TPA: hypothetical protein VG457_07910 [Planctomycetota bacterium]|jgi:hypothetical protein|nr:hypothetical protein [Planctomycetota bacterium]
MSADSTSILLTCLALGTLFLVGLFLADWRSRSMLEAWGRANGFEILSHEECWALTEALVGRSVYRLTVRDTVGRRRSGYARCGLRWLGLLPDQIAVRWDD